VAILADLVDELRELPQRQKPRKTEVCQKIGRHEQAIEKVEKGEYSTTLVDILTEYAEMLGYTLRFVLTPDTVTQNERNSGGAHRLR
jgi:transcriptional regulator with XRE-family HTH domain